MGSQAASTYPAAWAASMVRMSRAATDSRSSTGGGSRTSPVGLVGGDDVCKSLVTRDSVLGRLSRTVSTKLTGDADMAMPLMRGIGPTLIPRPQRMYLRFGEPIDTTKPNRVSTKNWVASVRNKTRQSLETILTELLAIRADDPFRELSPLAWASAVEADAQAQSA